MKSFQTADKKKKKKEVMKSFGGILFLAEVVNMYKLQIICWPDKEN